MVHEVRYDHILHTGNWWWGIVLVHLCAHPYRAQARLSHSCCESLNRVKSRSLSPNNLDFQWKACLGKTYSANTVSFLTRVFLCVVTVCLSPRLLVHATERGGKCALWIVLKVRSWFRLKSKVTGLTVRAGFMCVRGCGLTASARQIVLATWRQRVRSQALLTISSPVSWKLNSKFSCSVGGRTTKAKAFTHSGKDSTVRIGKRQSENLMGA